MAREPVFYSFHYDNDVFRVQQIRNIGVIEGDEPVSANEWESIKARGDAAVEKWIDDNMKYKRCVIVLIGSQTAYRPWVLHEIKRAWEQKRGLFGIYIHNLKCPRSGTCTKGVNPFTMWNVNGQSMAGLITCREPHPLLAYADIAANMQSWVAEAIAQARYRP
jgi:hypothetical protein